jgi:hypothetical protein
MISGPSYSIPTTKVIPVLGREGDPNHCGQVVDTPNVWVP